MFLPSLCSSVRSDGAAYRRKTTGVQPRTARTVLFVRCPDNRVSRGPIVVYSAQHVCPDQDGGRGDPPAPSRPHEVSNERFTRTILGLDYRSFERAHGIPTMRARERSREITNTTRLFQTGVLPRLRRTSKRSVGTRTFQIRRRTRSLPTSHRHGAMSDRSMRRRS